MYIPEFNRVEDSAAIAGFVKANPFAILVSCDRGIPFATHLPILAKMQDDKLVLIGHVAKANSHWKCLQQDAESLAIFHGAHAYISPSLYDGRENVPTWNYAAVHVYGKASTFSEEARLTSVLQEMINTFEPAYMPQWNEVTAKYRENMLRHIVGFEILATRIEAKFKLSQNRTQSEQLRVTESLQQSDDCLISETGKMMEALRRGSK